jgi:glutaminyl-peptide cyclotransferase
LPGRLALVVVSIAAATFTQISTTAPRAGFTVVHVYPHDRGAFTQGLEYAGGYLWEGTGLNGRSSVRKVKLETGEVLMQHAIPPDYFGEGITLWKSDLIELTWRSEVALVFDRATFAQKRSFSYAGEGWGLTHNDTELIMSDGTSELRFLDPATFAEKRRLKVTDNGRPVPDLNELEWVKGQVFANVWRTDLIARIDPASGRVAGWIDLAGILPAADRQGADVMNGIAYDAAHDRLFVTGKNWPKLFEIKITP